MRYFLTLIITLFSTLVSNGQDNLVKHEKIKKEELIVIDVRTLEEYNNVHIEGAILLPYNELSQKIGDIVKDKDKAVALYCRSGSRSGVALRAMISMGYTNAVNYGGYDNAKRILDSKK